MARAIELTDLSWQKRARASAGARVRYRLARPAARLLGRAQWPALNGQRLRRATVKQLLRSFLPDAVVETGTFWGSSTLFFAHHAAEVYSAEISPHHYFVACQRMRRVPNATLLLGPSTDVIRWIAEGPGARWERAFLYLDAHWHAPLPLREEIELASSTWSEFLVVVDDCRIPHDPEFGYDDYGSGERIDIEYMRLRPGTRVFVPGHRAADETGARRGTCYLGFGAEAISCLESATDAGLVVEASLAAK